MRLRDRKLDCCLMRPAFLPFLAAAAISAGASAYANKKANEASIAQADKQMAFEGSSAKEAMEFSAAEAQKNRDFQERMSSTAISRIKSDAIHAGINPYYLISGGHSASTPSGSAGQGFSARGSVAPVRSLMQDVGSNMSSAYNVSMSARKLKDEIRKLEGEAEQAEADGAISQRDKRVALSKLGRFMKYVDTVIAPFKGLFSAGLRKGFSTNKSSISINR